MLSLEFVDGDGMNQRIRHIVLTCFLAMFSLNPAAIAGVQQIVLVQNSGWMLPFYEDPSSGFKGLVLELSSRLYNYGAKEQAIASFNQSCGDNKSPQLHYSGTKQDMVRRGIAAITPALKPGTHVYTDTDFKEAIVGAVTKFSPGKPCVLWIITNNKNSPDNSLETVKRNREFYEFVNGSDEITRIAAFPYAMKAQSVTRPEYRADGLMIYAIAYGEEAGRYLQKMLFQNVPFGQRAARLKPLNAEAMTFIPKYVRGSESVTVNSKGRTLLLGFDAKTTSEEVEITGNFLNDFYPYDIVFADLAMAFGFSNNEKGIYAKLSTDHIENIVSGKQSSEVTVRVTVPPFPSPWDPEVIFGSSYRSNGLIRFELQNQKLALSSDFRRLMYDLFPNDPLPDLFVPGVSSSSSVTLQPLAIQVIYPSWPLVVGGVLFFAIFGGAIGGFVLFSKEKMYHVSVDGVRKTFRLKLFAQAEIINSSGEKIGMIKRGISKPEIMLDKEKTVGSSVRLM